MKNCNIFASFILAISFLANPSFAVPAKKTRYMPPIINLLLDDSQSSKDIYLDKLKAFPTAYGSGAESSGGRGGVICYIDRLDDPNSVEPDNNFRAGDGFLERINSGIHRGNYKGSFRGCMKLKMPRIVYFLVGGRFEIERIIALGDNAHDDLTIAGETSLSLGGLHVTGEYGSLTVNPNDSLGGNRSLVKDIYTNNVDNMIIRFLDRKGLWEYWRDWGDGTDNPTPPRSISGRMSPLNINNASNVMIDHYSGGWGSYSLTIGGVNANTDFGGKITVQSSLMHENIGTDVSENLEGYVYTSSRSGHNVANLFGHQNPRDENGNYTLEHWRKFRDISVYDTAYIGLTHRFPNMSGYTNSRFYTVNNYIDNWGSRGSYIGGSPRIDLVNNYYRKLSGQVNTSSNDPGKYRTILTLDPDSQRAHNLVGDVQTPSILTKGNVIETSSGDIFDNDINGNKNWVNMAGYWKASQIKHRPLNDYNRTEKLPALKIALPLKSATKAKADILAHGRGANARIYPDGSTYIDSAADKRYFNWANNSNTPTIGAVVHGDGGLGDSARFVHPYYPSRSISLDSLDSDGVPLNWRLPKEVINNAGYTRLELYLADIAGDYTRLGLIKPQINVDNVTSAKIERETNSVGLWSRNSVTLSKINDLNYVYTGNYALRVLSNTGGYSNVEYSFSAERGTQYQVSFWAARSKGTTQGLYAWEEF